MSLNKTQIESFLERNGYGLEKHRATMDALRTRFNTYKRQLKAANLYQPTDDTHIVTIVLCEEIQMRAFMDIETKGTLMKVSRIGKVMQKNHSISTFYQMSKMILEVSKKLGLSPLDRMELKVAQEETDGMND